MVEQSLNFVNYYYQNHSLTKKNKIEISPKFSFCGCPPNYFYQKLTISVNSLPQAACAINKYRSEDNGNCKVSPSPSSLCY